MRLLLLVLLAITKAATAFMSVNFQDSGVLETGTLQYMGVELRSFKVDDMNVLEPYIALEATERARVLRTPVGSGYYFSVPLIVDSEINASRDGKKLSVMKVTSLSVSFRDHIMSGCSKDCSNELAVTSQRKQDQHSLIFRCLTRSTCQRMFNALHFNTTASEFIRSALKFTFYGVSNGRSLQLTKAWVPVVKTSERPFPRSLWFEGDKLLLYTIKAGVGENAYQSFIDERVFSIPTDDSLPDVYRSELLDSLPSVLATRSGDWEIVAEMRTDDEMVAQIVFDVSRDRDLIDKTNWYRADRVKSSYPFWIGLSGFNFFSMLGDSSLNRQFFINNGYGGCHNDNGFWAISVQRDICPWANIGWKGRSPVLVYNRFPGKYQDRGAAYADRFFVYLRYTSIHSSGPVLSNSFHFEGNKILLFAIKSGIGRDALQTYRNRQNFPIPANNSLPDVYRSDLIDSLREAVVSSGKKLIVAEMRVGNRPVTQVFFDVSVNRQALTSESWFSSNRLVSSTPYFIGTYNFSHFSIIGDDFQPHKRHFFISINQMGCVDDTGLWVVSEKSDPCRWANKFWTGMAPTLIYNPVRDSPFELTGARADQFLIYMV